MHMFNFAGRQGSQNVTCNYTVYNIVKVFLEDKMTIFLITKIFLQLDKPCTEVHIRAFSFSFNTKLYLHISYPTLLSGIASNIHVSRVTCVFVVYTRVRTPACIPRKYKVRYFMVYHERALHNCFYTTD